MNEAKLKGTDFYMALFIESLRLGKIYVWKRKLEQYVWVDTDLEGAEYSFPPQIECRYIGIC